MACAGSIPEIPAGTFAHGRSRGSHFVPIDAAEHCPDSATSAEIAVYSGSGDAPVALRPACSAAWRTVEATRYEETWVRRSTFSSARSCLGCFGRANVSGDRSAARGISIEESEVIHLQTKCHLSGPARSRRSLSPVLSATETERHEPMIPTTSASLWLLPSPGVADRRGRQPPCRSGAAWVVETT